MDGAAQTKDTGGDKAGGSLQGAGNRVVRVRYREKSTTGQGAAPQRNPPPAKGTRAYAALNFNANIPRGFGASPNFRHAHQQIEVADFSTMTSVVLHIYS